MKLPDHVGIVEVGLRDGLQNEPVCLFPRERAQLIDLLSAAGLRRIEAGSFVSVKAVPQMAGTAEVIALARQSPDLRLSVLTPNLHGLKSAFSSGVAEVAVVVAASETFSRRNLNCSMQQSLERANAVALEAQTHGFSVRGYISCVLGSPYEGGVEISLVAELAKILTQFGCYEISLGDTIGVGTPSQARRLVEHVATVVPLSQIAGHFHDTYGQALANIFACLEVGLNVFDSSIGGLGGCPFAPGATGNVATEDLIYMLEGCDIETGVDLDRLCIASGFVCARLGHMPASHVMLSRLAGTAPKNRAPQIDKERAP